MIACPVSREIGWQQACPSRTGFLFPASSGWHRGDSTPRPASYAALLHAPGRGFFALALTKGLATRGGMTVTAPTNRTLLRPLVRELPADVDTPISVYLKLRGLGPSFLLESVEGGEHLARYSFDRRAAARHPALLARPHRAGGRGAAGASSPLARAMCWTCCATTCRAMHEGRPPACPASPAARSGYMSYDLVRSFERLPDAPRHAGPARGGLPAVRPPRDLRPCQASPAGDRPRRADARQTRSRRREAALDEMVARLQRPLPAAHAATGRRAARRPSRSSRAFTARGL